jgi:hypothetical protein
MKDKLISLNVLLKIVIVITFIFLVWYLYSLNEEKLLIFGGSFDFKKMEGQYPFVSEFIMPFIAIISSILLYLNLKEIRITNKTSSDSFMELKRYNDSILENTKRTLTINECKNYYLEKINNRYIEIVEKKIISVEIDNIASCVESKISDALLIEQEKDKIRTIISVHNVIIATHINQIEAFSSIIINCELDISLSMTIIGKQYLAQVKRFLPFILYYKSQNDSLSDYGRYTIELYEEFKKKKVDV